MNEKEQSQLKQSMKKDSLGRQTVWSAVLIACMISVLSGCFSAGSTPLQGMNAPPVEAAASIFPGLLYRASSPWNVPIGSHVILDPHSSAIAARLADGNHVPAMFEYGMPIYVGTARDPLYKVVSNDHAFNAHSPFHIPATAAPSPGSDKWMFIYDTTKQMIFEMWRAEKKGNTWTTQAGAVFSPTGDGVLQVDGTQSGGNGASYFGGVVRAADIQRGYINHALSLASAYTATTWRYPMSGSDGQGTGPEDAPMGARVQLDPSVNCQHLPHASVGEKMVCKALQTYGGYVHDSAGAGVALSVYFEGENLNDPNRHPPNGSPGNPGREGGIFDSVGLHDQQEMQDIPWNKLRVLKAWNSFTVLNQSVPPASLAFPFCIARNLILLSSQFIEVKRNR